MVAEKIIELEKTKEIAKASYNAAIQQAQAGIKTNQKKLLDPKLTDEQKLNTRLTIAGLQDSIFELQNARDSLDGALIEAVNNVISTDRGSQIRDFVNQATSDLNDLESVAIRVSQSIGDAVGQSLTSGVTSLIDGTATAQEVFANFMKSIADVLMQEAAKMIATYTAIGIAKMFAGMSGGGAPAVDKVSNLNAAVAGYGLANGGVFNGNGSGISTFANGGMFTNSIVKSPTLFKFADGGALRSGVMGEAGPEAVMPLTRASDGRLGVDASGLGGGGDVSVVVNVDAKGTSVQGSDQNGAQLGRVIAAAVQQQIIKEKRPGGLLS